MKKLFSIICCLLVLCSMLCACGKSGSVSEMASDAVSDVATEAGEMLSPDNGTVSDDDGVIGNESTSSDNNSNNSTNTDSTNNQNDNNSNNNNSNDNSSNGNSSYGNSSNNSDSNNSDDNPNPESATDVRNGGLM